eukprot:5702193-Lingulodinium_polyedra.AAC.1
MQAHRCLVWSVSSPPTSNQRVYLLEQPDPSGLFTEHFWPRAQAHPHNIVQLVPRCTTGQR